MTVSTEVDHNEYTGNGVTTSFPYTFRIFNKSDLVVQVVDLDENIAVLALDTDYSVTGAGGYNGGNVILSKALANGYQISISRELPVTQETDLRNQGKFFAEVHEDAFDKLTMLIQQVRSWFGLALRKPSFVANYYDALNNYIRNLKDPRDPQDATTKKYVDTLTSVNLSLTLRVPESIPQLPDAATRANKMPAFDSIGNPIVVLPPAGSASDVLIELAKPTGTDLIGYKTPVTGKLITVKQALDEKSPNIIGSFDSPDTGFIFNSFTKYSADHDFRLTDHGSTIVITKKLKKNGHETITLSSTVDPTPPVTVDTVAYVDPTSFEGGFPQEILIEGITFEGDDDGMTEVGLTIHEGQRFQLRNLSFDKVKKSIQFYSWVTQLDFIMSHGQIHQTGGTSTTYRNVGAWVNDDSVLPGAFRIENAQYSNMVCCTSDGTIRTAYYINNCNGLTMTSCACELPSATDIGMGVAMHLQSGNDNTINDFICIPKDGESNPIVSVQDNNYVTFNNPLFSWGKSYSWDFYIHGPGNHIVINGGKFGTGIPLIGCTDEAAGSTIVYNTSSNIYAARITSAQNALQLEPLRERRSIDGEIAITFGDSTTGVGLLTRDVKYNKNGSLVTIEFIIRLNGFAEQSGAMRMRNLPHKAANQASGVISITFGLTTGRKMFTASIDRGNDYIDFYKFNNPDCDPVGVSDVNVYATIKGSITYSIDSYWA
ncbi:hypothetical protein ACNENB_001016 [Escherichia coli]